MTEKKHTEAKSLDEARMRAYALAQRPLNWILALAALYTLYFSKPLVMPIVLALILSMLLSPAVALCKKMHIPRSISSAALIALLVVPFVLLSIELAVPAQKWITRLPQLSAEITEELNLLGETIIAGGNTAVSVETPEQSKSSGFNWFGWFGDNEESQPVEEAKLAENILVEEVKKGGIEVLLATLGAAPAVVAQMTLCLVLLLFMLIFGPNVYNNFVGILPFIRDKEQASDLVTAVRKQLSRYMLTVTVINIFLGAATAVLLAVLGMEDALLWGVLVALMNFAPYAGPIVSMAVLLIAGVAQYGLETAAVVPAGAFFLLNVIEAQFITPTALGKHMRLNPLILIIWILAWGWVWGPVGVFLAVPLLVCAKLVVIELGVLKDWVRLIETRA